MLMIEFASLYGQEVLKVGGKGRKEGKGQRRAASFSSDDGDSDSSSMYEWEYVDEDLAGVAGVAGRSKNG
jgi:hypothetical protein